MIRFTRSARKALDGLSPVVREKANGILGRLDAEPALGIKLRGKLEGLRSVGLVRTHRIIYKSDERGPIVVAIVRRKDSYR